MNRFMVIGGFVGFLVVFLNGLVDGRNIFIVLRDSMIACLVMAFLLRILYKRIESSLVSVLEKERRAMRDAAKQESKQEEEGAGSEEGTGRAQVEK